MMVVMGGTRMMELETLILCPSMGVGAADDCTVLSKQPQTDRHFEWKPAF